MVWTIQSTVCVAKQHYVIEKFETRFVLVNVNKFKPYKYMESKVQTKE